MLCELLFALYSAAETNVQVDWNVWKGHSGLPEVYDMKFRQAVATQYPLRPGQ